MQDQELDELLRRTMEPPPSAGVTAAAVDLAERAKAAAHAAPAASKSRPWFRRPITAGSICRRTGTPESQAPRSGWWRRFLLRAGTRLAGMSRAVPGRWERHCVNPQRARADRPSCR